MNNFQKFYFDITGFRDEMKGAVKRYQVTIKELERFKGSAGYDEEMKKAETTYRTETGAIRALYSERLSKRKEDCLAVLRTHRDPLPTPEQIAALQALKLLDKPTKAQITDLMPQMKDCPLTMAALRDTALQHGYLGVVPDTDGDTAWARERTEDMFKAAQKFVHDLDNVGDTGDHVSKHAWSLFRLDHDYANAEECVSQFCAGTDVQMLEKFINIAE